MKTPSIAGDAGNPTTGQAAVPDQVEGKGPAAPGLAALATKFDQLEAGDGTGDAHLVDTAPAEPPEPSNAEVVAGMVCSIRETVCIVAGLESPRKLTDDMAAQLGAVWGPVLDGFGVKLGASMGKFAPVMAAAFATFKLVGPIVSEVRAEVIAKDKGKPAAQLQDGPAAAPRPAAPPPPASNAPAFTEGTVKPRF